MPSPPGQSQPIFGSQGQPPSMEPPRSQGQTNPLSPNRSGQGSNVPSPLLLTPQNSDSDVRPGLGPYQNLGHSRKSSRPLSTEDLVARSPARPQFGQQAPYQLRLPGEPGEDDLEDQPHPIDRNAVQLVQGGRPNVDKSSTPERSLPTTRPLNTQFTQPALRHPMSPATYPLPEDTLFSPVISSAAQVPPPPPPKWPDQATPSQSLDRSNTINTHASTISQMSGQLHVPSPPPVQAQGAKDHPDSITPPSPHITPQITPERSPEQRSTLPAISSPAAGNKYTVSPLPSPLPPGHGSTPGAVTPTRSPQPSQEKIPVSEGIGSPVGFGRRRASQEEKILVEEGLIRPGSSPVGPPVEVEDVVPSMSATSYPGQEWHPYGNGYEEWD